MKLDSLVPILRTWNLAESMAFYTNVLGFECERHEPDREWASLCRDDVRIMFAPPNAHEGDVGPKFTGSLYIRTDDVAQIWAHIRGRCRVCYSLEDFDYGMREFAIYDNNGYVIQFGQPI